MISSEGSYEPLRRLLSDKKIESIRSSIRIRSIAEDEKTIVDTIKASDIDVSNWQPKLLVAIDGDYSKTNVENGYPGAEIGYITVSSVVILLDRVRELESSDFIDPIKFRQTEQASSIDSLFVGCNVVLDDEDSAKSSMRKILFNELNNKRIFNQTETLLDTYQHLLQTRPGGNPPKCPHDGCEADIEFSLGEYFCSTCKKKLYSTDALRLHELLNPSGTSGEMFGQITETFKKLQLIHILRSFEQHPNYFSLLKDIAFFVEGTLAVFSTASWLAIPIRKELARINQKVKDELNSELIILGVERSGNFVNHFESIDTKLNGISDYFMKGSAFLLSNNYIKKNIVLNDTPGYVYLKDTAFGRKFFYKTKSGYRVVCSLATYSEYQANPETAFPEQFPRLGDIFALLDKLVSSRYENSLIPLSTAHAEAAIPLNLGKRIFEEIARQIQGQSK